MSTKKREFKVKIVFEPNRIAKKHLADAYNRLFSDIDTYSYRGKQKFQTNYRGGNI